MKSVLGACFLTLAVAMSATAQQQGTTSLDVLEPAVRATVQRIVDSARVAGLPTEPLVSKALEGAAKRASGERIESAVRAFARALGRSRGAVCPRCTETELIAGAGALQAGADSATLARVRALRPRGTAAVPFIVLADLITRGVPADAAADAVETLARTKATDADFGVLRRDVVQDIVAGAKPAGAALERARSMATGRSPDGG